MKKLHAALLTAGLISADTAEGDDQMAQAFEAGLTALAKTRNDELAGVRAELETAKAETAKAMEKLAARVIDGAVAAKLLKDEPATREAWVKAYALDPAGTEAKLASISAPAPAARGVPASEVGEATSAAEALAAAEAFAKEADPVKRADLWKKHRKAILDCANAARR